MQDYCINKLLNLEDVIIKNIKHFNKSVEIHIETKSSTQKCPVCGSFTSSIHDYRKQIIKDLPFQFKNTYLVLNKRRYRCSCGKRFYEKYSFLPRYYQRTVRLTKYIVYRMQDTRSIKDVANDTNVSPATVQRILNKISYVRPHLHEAFSIDEFKGDAAGEKYQCILVDPINKKVLDILPNRNYHKLANYLYSIPKDERYRVKYFVCDMWKPYVDLAHVYFPNAKVIIDKYHFIRQTTWAIENVRKRLQKNMPDNLRKYYKRSRSIILHRYDTLKPEAKAQCDLMLLYNEDLRKAHWLKEWFYKICQNKKYSDQRVEFYQWIKEAERSNIKEFQKCAKTYRNWSHEILNALKYSHITNGPTEGFNNKIKVIKRTSYGIRNFRNLRTRILLATH